MTKQDVLESIALKKRFCKDYNIQMSVYDNPYFYSRLLVMDRVFDCVQKFELFCSELDQFGSEQEYFEEYNRVKEAMISAIRENKDYVEFNHSRIPKKISDVTKRNLYVETSNNCTFISIDMKQANFSALKYYSEDIFCGCKTWESFVKRFTNIKHIAASKYIRQVVLGALNPSRQIQYETYIMSILCDHIESECNYDDWEPYSLAQDEIIIKVNNDVPGLVDLIREIVSTCDYDIGNLVRVEYFALQKVSDYGWIKKDLETGKISFKCFDSDIIVQIIKYFFMLPIKEDDLVFYHNGRLAKFLKEVENPW